MREIFVLKKFSPASLRIISSANEIIQEYKQIRLQLTLRQLYYQFVSRDLIRNNQTEYKRLGSIINDARMAGEIDWDAIEDRTRNSIGHDGSRESPKHIFEVCAEGYSTEWWKDQPYYVEVWVEKEALAGVIEPVCDRLRVRSFACKGYTSQSEMYAAGLRIREAIENDKKVKIIHLGDHDPSGIDMTRDIEDRLIMFGFPAPGCCDIVNIKNGTSCSDCADWYCRTQDKDIPIKIERIALNITQIHQYNPPPNPAKSTDGRFKAYQKKFGDSSWELDALEPTILQELIRDAINDVIDRDKWKESRDYEETERQSLRNIADRYEDIVDFIRSED